MTQNTVGLCIPTLNPGRWIDRLVAGLEALDPPSTPILVLDSSSTDGTVERLRDVGAQIVTIPREQFDHGRTRNMALDLLDTDVVVYLTQDAIPVRPDSITKLTAPLEDARFGMTFGRQLPRPEATAATKIHRTLLYPAESSEAGPESIEALGVRASFASNSFSAYRRDALEAIGRFPEPVISHEDRWAAGKMLIIGRRIRYVADAVVEHSHEYTVRQTVSRYFDAGVFEATNAWHQDTFGRPHGLGRSVAAAQIRAARAEGRAEQARVIARGAAALVGHQLGTWHHRLPVRLRRRLTMAPNYFLPPVP